MEEKREDRPLHKFCYRAGKEKQKLEMEDKKASEHPLSDILAGVANGFPNKESVSGIGNWSRGIW